MCDNLLGWTFSGLAIGVGGAHFPRRIVDANQILRMVFVGMAEVPRFVVSYTVARISTSSIGR
jgi:hypothetical protein